ncbi:MAG: hypothetical protein OER88_07145 [Planctomycetota bacterium]|nr:hypothetical protein [Planctomycetota bacterium]
MFTLLITLLLAGTPLETVGPPAPETPADGAVPLPAQSGWEAHLVLDNDGVGVWTVESFDVFPQLGCPDVVGLDDEGRCNVLISYSGRWTKRRALHDGKWLGGLAFGDIDPRLDGPEVYTGSQRGNIYLVKGYAHGTLDGRLIARLPGREIHTIVAGELDAASDGREVIVFTRPGGLYRLTPTGKHGRWDIVHLQDLPGRVRHAVVLPGPRKEIATVARTGHLRILRLTKEGPQWTTVYKAKMGLGRIALRRDAPDVIYSTRDDGCILRHARGVDGAWSTATIYRGPQGPRGIVAGRFDADPNKETVAIFGYSGRVELLTRGADGWKAETLFIDSDKGHWLAVAELDGRNATREIISSGYSGRIVMISRPAGYGVKAPAPRLDG